LTGFAPNENEGTLRIMAKWVIIFLISVIVYKNLTHAIELEKLEMKLAWEESKKCIIPPPPPPCPICQPRVVELPCTFECPPAEDCKSYYEMCIEGD
jgi:hypothetical protein